MSNESLTHFDEMLDVLDGMTDNDINNLTAKIGAMTSWQGNPPGSASFFDDRGRDEDELLSKSSLHLTPT